MRKIEEIYKQEPNLKGLVLDLRNDPGGLLDAAVAISAAFLPENVTVVSTNGQLPESKFIYRASPESYRRRGASDPLKRLPAALKNVPLVVLVNEGSASASEIVAGALQDHKRATIMGRQTFGKGSVQTVRPLGPDTGLKITTARYYTPSGASIQAKGIVPDVMVDETEEGNLFAALRTREADLEKHLTSGQGEEEKDAGARKGARNGAQEARRGKQEAGGRSQDARIRHRQGLPADAGAQPAQGPPGHGQQDPDRAQGRAQEQLRPRLATRPAAGRTMNDEQLLRYSRHILLDEIGIEGQERISAAHALVIGAGGLGSPVALYLGSAGVGRITLVDDDTVDLTNLQRQIAHTTAARRPAQGGVGQAGDRGDQPATCRSTAVQQRADARLLATLAAAGRRGARLQRQLRHAPRGQRRLRAHTASRWYPARRSASTARSASTTRATPRRPVMPACFRPTPASRKSAAPPWAYLRRWSASSAPCRPPKR